MEMDDTELLGHEIVELYVLPNNKCTKRKIETLFILYNIWGHIP